MERESDEENVIDSDGYDYWIYLKEEMVAKLTKMRE